MTIDLKRKILFAAALGLAISCYIVLSLFYQESKECEDFNDPALVAVASDQTKLWAVCRNGRYIYFSTSGTHTTHQQRSGKTSERINDDVPNKQD